MKQFLAGFVTAAVTIGLVLTIGGRFWLKADGGRLDQERKVFATVEAVDVPPSVDDHTRLFEKRFEEPVPGVHVAIGHGLANVVVIDAPDGLIVVDTLESIRAAEGLLPWIDGLREATNKVITDIVYTHNHADHVFGAGVFLQGQGEAPRIWAHALTQDRVHEVVNVLAPIIFERSMRMFGTYLPDESFANNGIGPRLLNDDRDGIHFLLPTDTVQGAAEVEMAGETVVLRHAPGETPDQLMIYLPARSVLLPADNYYHAFPNLYTIRGTPYRDPRHWVETLDLMRSFGAAVMIPQHSQPVLGAEAVDGRLRDYRDAIQFVYDETIRMINAGLTPDVIAERIELPPHLAQAPHLQEFYGRVEWAARSVFAGTLGWFSGEPSELRPVTPGQEAALMADLAGGEAALAEAARSALDAGEAAWALTLSTHLERLDVEGAGSLRALALRALASTETSSSGRNYFLTAAAEAEGFELPPAGLANTPDEVIHGIPIRNFLASFTVNLRAGEVLNDEMAYGFDFTDEEPLTVRIRRGVAFVEEGLAEDRGGSLVISAKDFRGIALGRLTPARLLVAGDMEVEGSIDDLNTFLGYFAPPI